MSSDLSHAPQEMVPGGELFHHLDLEGAFDEATAQFYAASVLLALEFLHSKGVVYRCGRRRCCLSSFHCS